MSLQRWFRLWRAKRERKRRSTSRKLWRDFRAAQDAFYRVAWDACVLVLAARTTTDTEEK